MKPELPNGQAIHITFNSDDGTWVVMLHTVRSLLPEELSEEQREEVLRQNNLDHGIPDGMAVLDNEVLTQTFDTLQELQDWLIVSLDKLWVWLVGIVKTPAELGA
jgi:hypothetical protein